MVPAATTKPAATKPAATKPAATKSASKTTLVFGSKATPPVLPPAPAKAGFPVVPAIAALGVLGVAIVVLKK